MYQALPKAEILLQLSMCLATPGGGRIRRGSPADRLPNQREEAKILSKQNAARERATGEAVLGWRAY